MIPPTDIQKLVDLPIEEVAGRLGLSVRHHVSLCPFHDDKRPSLHFNTARNRYHCYVCGAHGRTIDLVAGRLNLKFVEACKWLADEHHLIVETHQAKEKKRQGTWPVTLAIEAMAGLVAQPVLTEEARRFLFEERRLDPRVISWCGISSTHDHLLIPYFNTEGRLIGLQWRYLGTDKTRPRFRFPRGSWCSIYNLQVLKHLHEGEPLYICEGASDCWAMLSSGHKAIAIPSATLLKPQDLHLLRTVNAQRSTPLHMYPDQDEPGERLFLELRQRLTPSSIIRHQLPPDCKDYSEYYLTQIGH